ncbi:hypothetical protein [Devosia sp. SD17-2]|uniref:hypothetical protein n=1 Tax=Devosia sp. SD17-2 TaxID=2976459 RepID=UPI0023D7C830|nr:hypothetical protein [Devosia sp. SD17-2]WEJ35050.1 hypothetical protein NYQ88_09735 [Devosia sp. SD17-2]
MEMIFAPVIVLFTTAGLALGLILRGRPLQSSCGGMSCLPDADRCAACPKKLREAGNHD